MKTRILLTSLCLFLQIIQPGYAKTLLKKMTSIQNTAIGSNQVAFSTYNLPLFSSVTVYCALNNQADFYGYMMVTPYSGWFDAIDYTTCWTTGCGIAQGPTISLGLANTVVHIYGVTRSNRAVILTNYADQDLPISCWFYRY
ncbi:MAG: hypothetical protein Q8R79_02945 [Legionellaceae bacterium]|nr:hypothetical protein [Legionellaceae bacterium]